MGLKRNASNEGVKRLKAHLLERKLDLEKKRALVLKRVHSIDQDNKAHG